MQEMKLIPFTVNSIQKTVDERPYGINQINAPEVWDQAKKGEGVVIAILDTGIDTDHPDLKDRIIGGKNFTREGRSGDIEDRNGHGTHVAGTIAGSEDGQGVVGVAPQI